MAESTRADRLGVSSDQPFADSPGRWFVRGTIVGMLLMAAVNAISFFVRSPDWSGLVGPPSRAVESLGFPLVLWENGNSYGGLFVDYLNLGVNILFAVAFGAVIGGIAAKQTAVLNLSIQFLQASSKSTDHQPFQFTLAGLMVATTLLAVVATLARTYAARVETLVAIYAMGPLFLVIIAMLPRRLKWQQRVMIIVPATLTLIAVAIAVGNALGMEFDKVLMGVFLCWTPQTVFAALILTAGILVPIIRAMATRQTDGTES